MASTRNAFPRKTLAKCISLGRQLIKTVSKSGVDVSTAAVALGYKSVNGATKTSLAALKLYGLIEKPHGKSRVVPSDSLIQLQTSKGREAQEICRKLAIKPELFRVMHQERLNPADPSLVERWLLLQKYEPGIAKEATHLYCENARFVGLEIESGIPFQLPLSSEIRPQSPDPDLDSLNQPASPDDMPISYRFGLPSCDATLIFSKPSFGFADLAALRKYIDILEQSWRVRHRQRPEDTLFESSRSPTV